MVEKMRQPTSATLESSSKILSKILSLRQYFRLLIGVVLESILHPLSRSVIDPKTGKVLERYSKQTEN